MTSQAACGRDPLIEAIAMFLERADVPALTEIRESPDLEDARRIFQICLR